jgi:probable F420-dependent oxidoreductase
VKAMQHWFTYPLISHPYSGEFMNPAAIRSIAQAAERAGFAGIGFTDHPAPSDKWLNAGGHDALDPFVALTFVASVTAELRLIPNILVLPYRNPFVVAKAAASLDLLSGGRFVLSVATGYLRSEYRALGVSFEDRNTLFDEALAVIRGAWTTDRYSVEGSNFTAMNVSVNPKPGHVPLWIGGNSALTRRRVAAVGDCWNPFLADATRATSARTVPLEGLDDLVPMLGHLWSEVETAGRDPEDIDVAFTTGLPGPAQKAFDPCAHLQAHERMLGMGVTWTSVTVPGDSVAQTLEAVEEYGSTVINA